MKKNFSKNLQSILKLAKEEAIRLGHYKINDTKQGADATLSAIIGRMATYSGQVITWDEAIKMDNSKDKKGSLFGMPIAIKDLSDVENFPTTYGYINSKNNFPKNN